MEWDRAEVWVKVASILREKQVALEPAHVSIVLIKIVRIWDQEKAAVFIAVRILPVREADKAMDLEWVLAVIKADPVVPAMVVVRVVVPVAPVAALMAARQRATNNSSKGTRYQKVPGTFCFNPPRLNKIPSIPV